MNGNWKGEDDSGFDYNEPDNVQCENHERSYCCYPRVYEISPNKSILGLGVMRFDVCCEEAVAKTRYRTGCVIKVREIRSLRIM